VELDANFVRAHLWLGEAYEQEGLYREGIAEFGRERLPLVAVAQRRWQLLGLAFVKIDPRFGACAPRGSKTCCAASASRRSSPLRENRVVSARQITDEVC